MPDRDNGSPIDVVLARQIVGRLATGQALDGLGLDIVEGRIDLRGLPASGSDVGGPEGIVVLHAAHLERLDLRGAHLSSWRFHNSAVRDCRFEAADCRDWRLWNTTMHECRFSDADLEGSAVGTWHNGRGNAWETIDFTDADFRVGVSRGARYEDCDFSNADLTEVDFEQCVLVRCRFAGDLHRVIFDGRPVAGRPSSPQMKEVDFSRARFDEVEFLAFNLDGVVLPDDPDLRLVRRFPCAVARALILLEGDETPAAGVLRADLEARLQMLRDGGHEDDANVLNRRDYLVDGGEELAALAFDVLTQAEADCLRR
jgi:uncharacterized protein YjbI with pentapeptide repeats